MSNNTILNPGSSGDVISTEDISGVKMPRSKAVLGPYGVDGGDVSNSNPLPTVDPGLSTVFHTIRSKSFVNGDNPLYWTEQITGGATGTYISNTNAFELACTTASGDSIIKETRERFSYKYGTVRRVVMGALMGTIKTNVTQRIGYFTSTDGMFFEQDGTNLKVVTRTSATGSPVDTSILQSSWNLDKLDGTGVSGLTLDTSKINTFVIEFSWTGSGYVKFGFHLSGYLIFAHQVYFENTQTIPWTILPQASVRFELTNTGPAASSTALDIYSISILGDEEGAATGINRTIDNGPLGAATGNSLVPFLSARMQSSANSAIDITGIAITLDQVGGAVVYYQLVLNGTLTGATFANSLIDSITQYDTAATAISGGILIESGFVNSRIEHIFDLGGRVQISKYSGVQDTISVVLQRVSGNSAVAFIGLGIEEFN